MCKFILSVAVNVFFALVVNARTTSSDSLINLKVLAAKQALTRVTGKPIKNIKFSIAEKKEASDFYEYRASSGTLTVTGSSANALTRAVYDYYRNNHFGMQDWAGNNFRIPARMPDAPLTKNISPFQFRQAYNVVTAGYTTVYWTWERWEKELDWQAMHGFNMLMASVATEAIAERVWKKLGLTQEEIDSFYVTPSLLPWQRMGNIEKVGGTLPKEWHTTQLALQHKILKRMRELDMQPIVQSFAGFVPKSIRRIYPDLVLHNTLWNEGFPPSQRPAMLMPGHPLFATITKMFIEEWKKEFGEADYFLVDSFNELELPKTDKPITELLAEYGAFTYNAIKDASLGATWVIQGWMFGYQRHQWPPENVKALFSKVPDDKVLILDYANDYANSWEPVNGFNGKQWVYGFVPNMGGKTPFTGDLNLYATGAATTLASLKKNNLIGFSISGEGLENNNVIYELLADVAWSKDSINLHNWLRKYSLNRYGAYPESLITSWNLLRKSAYSHLIDHPQFNWQTGTYKPGRVNKDSSFIKSVAYFIDCKNYFKKNKNYISDLTERVALALGIKAELLFWNASKAYDNKNVKEGDKLTEEGLQVLTEMDKLLASHPLLRLDRWLSFAEETAKGTGLKDFYIADAKRIVTIWGPPVNDYSCRVWSGLIADFYKERMKHIMHAKKTGTKFDKNKWEINWVYNGKLTKVKPYENVIKEAARLFKKYFK